MKKKLLSGFIIAITLVMVISGCTGGGDPVTPSTSPETRITAPSADFQSCTRPQTHLWGFWTCAIDLNTLEIEAIPLRNSMFTANVVNFLNSNPSTLKFSINDTPSGPDYIDVDIDVMLEHPFPGLPRYNGYDVRGVFMGDGSVSLVSGGVNCAVNGVDQFMLPDPDGGNGAPDGYTRWFNIDEFSGGGMPLFQYTQGKVATPGFDGTSTLNPYKYFADGLDTNDDLWTWLDGNPDRDGMFASGASNARNYYLRFPLAKGVTFGYAVLADWTGIEPEYHPSNTAEAVCVDVAEDHSVYFEGPTSNGGEMKMDISVWNWDAALSAGVMEEYRIIIESSVLSAPYYADSSTMTPVGGTENYSTYQVEITADDVKFLDGNEFWVIVEETGTTYANDFGIPNLAENDNLCAYFRYDLEVLPESPECPIPIPQAITGSPEKNSGSHTERVTSTNLMGDTGLGVWLDMEGVLDDVYDIEGTGITNVDVPVGEFDATFDLEGVALGQYYVVVRNSCGEYGVSDEPLFIVNEYLEGDIYVSNHPDFDGLPEYGTMENPFHTIVAGINDSVVDDLILVDYGTGTYNEVIYLYGGARHITIRAYNWYVTDGGRPLIDGPDVSAPNVPTIQLVHVDYIHWRGFEITWGGGTDAGWFKMVELLWTENIIFEDCYFSGDVPRDVIRLVQVLSAYWTIDCEVINCLFKDINLGQNTVETNVQFEGIGGGWNIDFLIARNEFTQLQPDEVVNKSLYLTAIDIVFDYGGINIRNNLIHHVEPSVTGASVYYTGIGNLWPLANANPNNGLGWIEHNTIDQLSVENCPPGSASRLTAIENTPHSSLPATDIDINSNIASEITGTATQWVFGVNDPNVTDYSCLYHTLRGTVEWPWYNPAHEGVGCIYDAPDYVDSETEPYNYHLQSGSPCEGTGTDGEDMGCYGDLNSGEVIGLMSPE